MFNHEADTFYEAVGLTEEQAKDLMRDILKIVKDNPIAEECVEKLKELPSIGLAFATVHFFENFVQTYEEQKSRELPVITPDNSIGLFLGLYLQVSAFDLKSKAVQWLARWDKEALAYLTRVSLLIDYDNWLKLFLKQRKHPE